MDLARSSRLEKKKKRAKLTCSSSSSDSFLLDISESLLIEILSRLPCKSAFRFKLVCKRWHSLISSPFFVTFFNHRRHHHDPPPPDSSSSYTLLIQLIYYDGSIPVVIDYDRALVVLRRSGGGTHPVAVQKWLNFSFLLPCRNKRRIAVRASCHDLLLCSYSQVLTPESLYTDYYVCNLQTQQWVSLPPILHPPVNYAYGLLCVPSPCSLCHGPRQGGGGVDNSRCNFIAMRIPCPLDAAEPRTQIDVEILFSSSSKEGGGGQWRSYVVSSPVGLSKGRHLKHIAMVPFKGMLHWLNYPHIVVFDPCNAPGKISRIIDVQIDTIRNIPFIHSFGICCGRLRVAHSTLGEDPIYQCTWELEDYDTGKWSLVHKFIVPGNNWAPYVHLDGTTIYGRSDTSLWISNFQTGGGIDQKYELIPRGLRYSGNLSRVNAHAITVQSWPTPLPSLLS